MTHDWLITLYLFASLGLLTLCGGVFGLAYLWIAGGSWTAVWETLAYLYRRLWP